MTIQPNPRFEKLVKILDALNPLLVLLAVVGIFFDYSPLKGYSELPNNIVAVLFAVDFLLRLLAFPPWLYFSRGWGWIDFLASLPGFLVLVQRTPLIALLRIVRIGRFFRIIRILRFLRAFSFLKTMKEDSTWIQERIMKIGVSVVLVSMIGIVVLDLGARQGLEQLAAKPYLDQYTQGLGVSSFANLPTVWFVSQGGEVTPGTLYSNTYDYQNLSDSLPLANQWINHRERGMKYVIEVSFSEPRFSPDGLSTIPAEGILIDGRWAIRTHEIIMSIAIATLLATLLVIMFYMGAVFARDVKTLQLVVDSFDAEDYFLLNEEAQKRGYVDEGELVQPEDDEMENLLKVAVKAARKMEAGDGGNAFGLDLGFAPLGTGDHDPSVNEHTQELEYRIEALLKQRDDETIRSTVQMLTPALVQYIKKKLT